MKTFPLLAAALIAAAFSATAPAQQPAADTSQGTAPKPADCGKPMAKHDHGAEKNMPTPQANMPCAGESSATAPAAKAKAKAHDHSKFHKTN